MADRHDYDRERFEDRGTERDRNEREGRWSDRAGRDFGREGEGREFGRDQSREVENSQRSGARGEWDRDRWGRSENRGYSGSGDWGRERERGFRGGYGNSGWNDQERGGPWETGHEGRSSQGWYGNEGRYSGSRWNQGSEHGASQFGSPEYGRSSSGLQGTSASGFGRGAGSGYGGGYGGYSGGMGAYGGHGRYSGRGPKGYSRSDDRVREDICERLTHHPEVDATEVEVQVKNGEVTLIGVVEARNMKRMAEEAAENVSGVKEVHNQLRVQQPVTAGGQVSQHAGQQGQKQGKL